MSLSVTLKHEDEALAVENLENTSIEIEFFRHSGGSGTKLVLKPRDDGTLEVKCTTGGSMCVSVPESARQGRFFDQGEILVLPF